MAHEQEMESDGFGRRGALAALLGTTAVAATAGSVQAAPASNVRKMASAGSPITTTIASTPLPNYAYRTLSYLDFFPLDPSATARTFAGSGGAYAAGVMEGSVEIPAGALLRDVEWYVANTSGSSATFYCALWTPASGYIELFAPTIVPSGSGLSATRTVVASADYGPYPAGAKLVMYAPTSSTILLNGVRLGFTGGGLEYYLRPIPVTIYDTTQAGGKFAAGEDRLVGMSGVSAGTAAAILRVTAFASTSAGTVKIYPANVPAPAVNSIPILANTESVGETTVLMPANLRIRIATSRAVHIKLDLIGTMR